MRLHVCCGRGMSPHGNELGGEGGRVSATSQFVCPRGGGGPELAKGVANRATAWLYLIQETILEKSVMAARRLPFVPILDWSA